jgi:predicted CopG family antitoxin
VAVEPTVDERGERTVWLNRTVADRLGAMRAAGESYSDVVLRLIEQEGSDARRSLAG